MRPLDTGKTITVLSKNEVTAGNDSQTFTIDSEAVLFSLYVTSITGTLTVTAWTQADTGKAIKVLDFPVISGPTTDLLLRKIADVMSIVRVDVSWTGACQFELRARGVSGGTTSVRLAGAVNAKASQINCPASETALIPVSLTDRAGLIIKNNTPSSTLWVGFEVGESVSGNGWPLAYGESIGVDLQAGQAVYGTGSTTIDVRILQAGG